MSAVKARSEIHKPQSEIIRVLLIEDNPGDARLIREMLAEAGGGRFKLECADRLSTGLERLVERGIDIVLLDLGLPDSQGFYTFAKAYVQAPRVPIVVLSGLADEQLAIKTVQEGAQDYLVKGQIENNLLVRAMRYAIERKQAEEALRESEEKYRTFFKTTRDAVFITTKDGKWIDFNDTTLEILGYKDRDELHEAGVLAIYVDPESRRRIAEKVELQEFVKDEPAILRKKDNSLINVLVTAVARKDENGNIPGYHGTFKDITERKLAEEKLQKSYDQLRATLITTVHTLSSTVEMRDPYTAGHQRRVTHLACAIAEEMGLAEEQFDGLHFASLIHDIGKIAVPIEILSRPGWINTTEIDIIKTHPQTGYNLLKEIEFPWPVAQIVLQHHERLDGSGYPQGLKNGGIMLEARILVVADVVEAMASHRPYRSALGINAALAEITSNKGILYDPEVVDSCERLFIEKGFKIK